MNFFSITSIFLIATTIWSCKPIENQQEVANISLVITDSVLYKDAIIDAALPEQTEISYGLTKLIKENPKLEWNAEQAVKVVTWTNWDGYLKLIDSTITTSRDTWVTAAPSLESFAEQSKLTKDSLVLAMEKLLGIPANSGKKYFVSIWVKPTDVFRPCLDPEITDDHCEVSLEKITTAIDSAHLAWIENLRANSYDTIKGYPWTQLGYTYDWAENGTEIGLSEFVIKTNSSIVIDKVETLEAFLQ